MKKKDLNMVLHTIKEAWGAELIYYNKEATKEGDLIERIVWKIDKSHDFPHGIKYRLVYIHNNKRILGYDNERMKGHHKHYFNKEIKCEFVSVEKLFEHFDEDVERARVMLYGNKEN